MMKDQFTLIEDEKVIAMPGVHIVAYVHGVPKNIGKGIDHFLNVFSKAYGKTLSFDRTGKMKGIRKFKKEHLDDFRKWLADSEFLAKKMESLTAHSGKSAYEPAPPAIEISLMGNFEPPTFILQAFLPVEVAKEPEEIIQLASKALAKLPITNGYCGYSMIWDSVYFANDQYARELIGPLLKKHAGLNYGTPVAMVNATQNGVAVVSWLTFLGADAVKKLGGMKNMDKKLPRGVSVLPLGKEGLMIRAGDAPQVDGVKSLYSSVAKLIKNARSSKEAIEDTWIDGLSREEMIRWLKRFW